MTSFPIQQIPIYVSAEILLDLSAQNPLLKMERDKEGKLIIMSPSGSEISRIQTAIVADLFLWNRTHNLGVVFDAQGGFTLPNGAVFAPDAAFVDSKRWNSLSAEQKKSFAPICPDVIFEVVSPSDSLSQQKQKMHEWLENGVKLGFLVSPYSEQVWVYRPQQTEILIPDFSGNLSGYSELPDFEIELKNLLPAK